MVEDMVGETNQVKKAKILWKSAKTNVRRFKWTFNAFIQKKTMPTITITMHSTMFIVFKVLPEKYETTNDDIFAQYLGKIFLWLSKGNYLF